MRTWTAAGEPDAHASMSAVLSWLSLWLTSADASSSKRIVSGSPLLAAQNSAVLPYLRHTTGQGHAAAQREAARCWHQRRLAPWARGVSGSALLAACGA